MYVTIESYYFFRTNLSRPFGKSFLTAKLFWPFRLLLSVQKLLFMYCNYHFCHFHACLRIVLTFTKYCTVDCTVYRVFITSLVLKICFVMYCTVYCIFNPNNTYIFCWVFTVLYIYLQSRRHISSRIFSMVGGMVAILPPGLTAGEMKKCGQVFHPFLTTHNNWIPSSLLQYCTHCSFRSSAYTFFCLPDPHCFYSLNPMVIAFRYQQMWSELYWNSFRLLFRGSLATLSSHLRLSSRWNE